MTNSNSFVSSFRLCLIRKIWILWLIQYSLNNSYEYQLCSLLKQSQYCFVSFFSFHPLWRDSWTMLRHSFNIFHNTFFNILRILLMTRSLHVIVSFFSIYDPNDTLRLFNLKTCNKCLNGIYGWQNEQNGRKELTCFWNSVAILRWNIK